MSKWQHVPLGECCEIVSGATPKTGVQEYWDGEILWATPKDLSNLPGAYIDDTPRRITQAGLRSCAATVLPAGSVLLSSRAPIGHVAINTKPMATNQGFKSLVPSKSRVDSKYLFYWLKANQRLLESLGNGATFKEISKKSVAKIEIPLPPLDEQRRIAAVLDKVDALRTKRREAIALLDDLTQSVFLDMFGKAKQATGRWKTETLQNLSVGFRYGTSNKSTKEGYPTLRIPNVIGDELDTSDLKFVPVPPNDFNRLRLIDGDLLFVRTNGNPDFVGRCSIFTEEAIKKTRLPADQFIYASYLIRVRLKTDTALPTYVREFMRTSEGRSALRSNSRTSAGQYNINTKGLGSIEIPVPPLDIQKNFEERLASIRRLKEAHRTHLAHLDELFASLQQRAFRGDLFSSEAA